LQFELVDPYRQNRSSQEFWRLSRPPSDSLLSLGSDQVSFIKKKGNPISLLALNGDLLSFGFQARPGSRKLSALPHSATTSHGKRTFRCRPIFHWKHFPDFDLKPFFK
jgi:hypothetical protein